MSVNAKTANTIPVCPNNQSLTVVAVITSLGFSLSDGVIFEQTRPMCSLLSYTRAVFWQQYATRN
jgi:hypothetical protein